MTSSRRLIDYYTSWLLRLPSRHLYLLYRLRFSFCKDERDDNYKQIENYIAILESFLNYYILNKADSNILDVSATIEQEPQAFTELIESNVSVSDTNMVLTIKPTNVKLNYNVRLSVAYKDLITGNTITAANTSIIYNVDETGVFSFYDSSLNTITYPPINLTNN